MYGMVPKFGEGATPQVTNVKTYSGSRNRLTLRRKSCVKLSGSSRTLNGLRYTEYASL